MWAERNRVRPRRDEEPKPSRWWRSRWNVSLPARKARNRFPGFAALAVVPNAAASSLHGFLQAKVQPGSPVMSDGWPGYQGLEPPCRIKLNIHLCLSMTCEQFPPKPLILNSREKDFP